MESFTVLCTKFHTILCNELLLSIVVLKLIFNYEVFFTNEMLTKCLGCKNLELFFRVAPKSIFRPLIWSTSPAIQLSVLL